ncbi:pirin family protein [Caldisphaera sp.]|uniref:pirin family protein n=1 Tax=Caldisphaera sp. TaxID=2060322 RepID=UPI003D0CB7F4
MQRRIFKIIKGRYAIDGAGVKLYRVFGSQYTAPLTDPFLLLDFFGSNKIEDYIAGFPWHPHRGIETITYLINGKVEHEDSEGNKGVLYPNDIQWMTAGSGIFHQEMPKPLEYKDQLDKKFSLTEVKGFQLWINLPSHLKMSMPLYRNIKGNRSPTVEIDKGKVKVVSGIYNGVQGPVNANNYVDPSYFDVKLEEEGEFEYKTKRGYNVLALVLEGNGIFEPNGNIIKPGELAIFSDGDFLKVYSENGIRFILLSGRPLKEQIAWYGPIVMNTWDQINEALLDLRNGNFIKNKAQEID